jgi:hypothetical protein
VVTVADRASVARIDTRFTGSGNGMRVHVARSLVRRTVPASPASQHTVAEGAEPAATAAAEPVDTGDQVLPPSSESSTPGRV